MFNVMYGQKVNKNWLGDIYGKDGEPLKEMKYRRLPYNLGYTQNSNNIRSLANITFKNSKNKIHRDLVKKYTNLEFENVLVIDDSDLNVPGGVVT